VHRFVLLAVCLGAWPLATSASAANVTINADILWTGVPSSPVVARVSGSGFNNGDVISIYVTSGLQVVGQQAVRAGPACPTKLGNYPICINGAFTTSVPLSVQCATGYIYTITVTDLNTHASAYTYASETCVP